MAKRGRPFKSPVRDRLIAILHHLGKAYGYQLHKVYCEIFGEVTRENVYYHLRKGVELGVFEIATVKKEEGDYSWGHFVEKIYYSIGPQAQSPGSAEVDAYFSAQN